MKIAISACLLGEKCRYDACDNKNESLLSMIEGDILIPFCPEDFAFGSPRATMNLIGTHKKYNALSNETGANLSAPIRSYAKAFFNTHTKIDLMIGKDRSPSCGVKSSKLYTHKKALLSSTMTGLMAIEAINHGIDVIDAENFMLKNHIDYTQGTL